MANFYTMELMQTGGEFSRCISRANLHTVWWTQKDIPVMECIDAPDFVPAGCVYSVPDTEARAQLVVPRA